MNDNPETGKLSFNAYMAAGNLPNLERAVTSAASAIGDGVKIIGHPLDNIVLTQHIVDIPGREMFACAPCSVINSVRVLGVDPCTDVVTISKRLAAAQNGRRELEPTLIRQHEGGKIYWVTPEGIDWLFRLIESPLGRPRLPISHFQTKNAGTVHEALLHGYKAVYIDQLISHAITIIGVEQKGTSVRWQILPPDDEILRVIQQIDSNTIMVSDKSIVRARWVDPRKIIGRVNFPVDLVGRDDNSWKPPEDVLEEGELLDLTSEE